MGKTVSWSGLGRSRLALRVAAPCCIQIWGRFYESNFVFHESNFVFPWKQFCFPWKQFCLPWCCVHMCNPCVALAACLRSAHDKRSHLEQGMQAVMQHCHWRDWGCHCWTAGLSVRQLMLKAAHSPWQPQLQVALCLHQPGFDLTGQSCGCCFEDCIWSEVPKTICKKAFELNVGSTDTNLVWWMNTLHSLQKFASHVWHRVTCRVCENTTRFYEMFFTCINTYVFKTRKARKTLVLKENFQVFNGYPCKNFTKYFCIFFCFITF